MRTVPRPLAALVLANAVVADRQRDPDRRRAVAGADHDGQRHPRRDCRVRRVSAVPRRRPGGRPGRRRDRRGAHRRAGEIANALVVAPLPVLLALDLLEIWHVLLLGFLGTLVDSAASTARQTLVPAVADAHAYPRERANALFTSAEHVGYLLGAPLAGRPHRVVRRRRRDLGDGRRVRVRRARRQPPARSRRPPRDRPGGTLAGRARRSPSSGTTRRCAACSSSRRWQ